MRTHAHTHTHTHTHTHAHTQEAYAALAANPVPERALDCLRRLVAVLCEEGQLLVLTNLPYAGCVMCTGPDGKPVAASLLREAVATLQRR